MSKQSDDEFKDASKYYNYDCEDYLKPLQTNKNKSRSIIKEIIKQIKPGTAFYKVSLPSFILKPVSLLETLSTNARPNSIIKNVGNLHSAEMRMAKITGWILSTWKHVAQEGVDNSKPYNPILGEVFKCHWNHSYDGSVTDYISEQVSHHPPRSAFYSYNKKRETLYKGWIEPYSSLNMNSLGTTLIGKFSFSLLKLGEEYDIKFPTVTCKGLLIGSKVIEMGDKLVVTCKKSKLASVINFEGNKVKGYITSLSNKKKLLKVYGVIDKKVLLQSCLNKKKFILYEASKIEGDKINVRDVNYQLPNESRRNWHKLTVALHKGDYETATKVKNGIESRQRKIRKSKTSPHVPMLFRKVGKTEDWEYIYAPHKWSLNNIQQCYALTKLETESLSKLVNQPNESDLLKVQVEGYQSINNKIKEILGTKKSKLDDVKGNAKLENISRLIHLTLPVQ